MPVSSGSFRASEFDLIPVNVVATFLVPKFVLLGER